MLSPVALVSLLVTLNTPSTHIVEFEYETCSDMAAEI